MSDRGGATPLVRLAEWTSVIVLAALVVALVVAPRAATSQSVAAWRARYARASAHADSLGAALRRGDSSFALDRTGRLVAGRRTVRFDGTQLSAGDTARIAEGLGRGAEILRSRFGEAGVRLIDGELWELYPSDGLGPDGGLRWPGPRAWLRPGRLTLAPTTPGDWERLVLDRPIDPAKVANFVVGRAGRSLVQQTPALRWHEGWSALLVDDEHYWSEPPRRLGVSWSVAGRRCASGSAIACRDVLAAFESTGALTRLFDVSDYRTVVASARLPALTDTVFLASRKRCLEGADTACARIAPEVLISDPFGRQIRGTLLTHAIELGGPGAVARLTAATGETALPLLARVAGVSEDSLIATWMQRTRGALDDERGTDAGLIATTAAWSALLLFLATRRRLT